MDNYCIRASLQGAKGLEGKRRPSGSVQQYTGLPSLCLQLWIFPCTSFPVFCLRLELEQELSDRRVELADAETVAQCVIDLRNTLSESPLAERKSFVRSFVKEVKVTGDEVLLTYTIPMLPGGMTEEKLPVLSIGHYGGRYWT